MNPKPRRRQLTDEERQELYENMQDDLESGECVVFDDSRASAPTSVRFCRKEVGLVRSDLEQKPFTRAPEGVFYSVDHALREMAKLMKAKQFWPNIYHINDHGNVTLWDKKGREIAAWV